MKCWRYYKPHGAESLRQALMNSCNPVFIGLGQKIGKQKYYEYLNKFGFLKKTGIDLPGEASSIFLKEEKVGPVELGTIAFGQRFEVTPIQMATMVSSIANGGKYVKPRIVKEIINSQNGEVTEIEPEYGEQVISSENASKVLSMMESVVAEGTGKNAQVQGYSVGGKTGTSEDGVNTGKYVASFVGVAPIEDPCIVILVTLYNPTGEGGHGGGAWVILTTHILINCKWKGFDNLSIRKEMKVDEVIVYMEYTQNGKSLEECILKILKQKVSYGGRVIKCQEESQNIN